MMGASIRLGGGGVATVSVYNISDINLCVEVVKNLYYSIKVGDQIDIELWGSPGGIQKYDKFNNPDPNFNLIESATWQCEYNVNNGRNAKKFSMPIQLITK